MRGKTQPQTLPKMRLRMTEPTTEHRLVRLDAGWLAAVERVENSGQAHPWSRRQLLDALSDTRFQVWGVVLERPANTLCGFAVLALQPFDAELQAITVIPQARRQGMARTLLQHLCREAEGWGSERLLLEVRASNQAAIALYRQMDFVDDGRRAGYYPAGEAGQREDALLMSRRLRR